MTKVAREVAEQEFERWLDSKKIRQSQREANQDGIDFLIESIQEGDIIIHDDNSITHKLLFPLMSEGQVVLEEVTYKPRLNDAMLKPHLAGVKPNDPDGRILAYIAALTSKPKAMLSTMDTMDKKISTFIAFFFL